MTNTITADPPRASKPARSRLGSFLKNLLLLVASVIVALLIAEFVVRFTVGGQIPIFPRNVDDATYQGGYRIRRNQPHARYFHRSPDGEWRFSINGQGMRSDEDYTYAKPANTLRVLNIGDSFTIGYETGQHETFSWVMERFLRHNGVHAQVLNAGVSGFGTAEELVYLEHEGLRFQPDVVVLAFYASDLEDNIRSGLFALAGDSLVETSKVYLPAARARNFLSKVPLWNWLSQHSYLHNYLNRVVTYKLRRVVVNQNAKRLAAAGIALDSLYRRRLAEKLVERVARDCEQRGIRFILMDVNDNRTKGERAPYLRTFPQQQLPTLLSHAKLTYFDSGVVLGEWRGITPMYQPHGDGHWTPFAHLLLGKRLADMVLEQCVNEGGQGGALCKNQQHAEQQQHDDDRRQPPLLARP